MYENKTDIIVTYYYWCETCKQHKTSTNELEGKYYCDECYDYIIKNFYDYYDIYGNGFKSLMYDRIKSIKVTGGIK